MSQILTTPPEYIMIDQYIEELYPYYQKIRQQIHANPELRYEEYKTSELVANELKKMDLKVMTGIGKTGVVGLLDTGKPGKTIALRADMDALPIHEETKLPYESKNNGIMHACGHDGHTASLLATAHLLTRIKDQFTGVIKFIFQPAEEGGAGAKAMIEAGVLQNPPVDVIFGYHNSPGNLTGEILARSGCTMYGNWEFALTVTGKGGHAAQPELAINPIDICSDITLAVAQIRNALDDKEYPTIVTITQLKGGFTTNVIPETAMVSGTIRAAGQSFYEKAYQQLQQLIEKMQQRYTCTIAMTMNEIYPPTINTEKEAHYVLEVAKAHQMASNYKMKSTRAAEDFSYFLQKVPGCYFFIGNGETSACCHNPHYDFNDKILMIAPKIMSLLVLQYSS